MQNPLFGALGAAYVFAPQKGANAEEVALLDNGLRHLHGVWLSQGFGDLNVEGAGAAGGLGAGVLAFSNGKLQSGIHTVLDLLDFDAAVCGAQYVITGEGRLDSQSFGGKVIDGVLRRKGDARVLAVVGISLLENAQNYGIERVFETNYEHLPFEQVKERAKEDMEICAQTVANYLRGCL